MLLLLFLHIYISKKIFFYQFYQFFLFNIPPKPLSVEYLFISFKPAKALFPIGTLSIISYPNGVSTNFNILPLIVDTGFYSFILLYYFLPQLYALFPSLYIFLPNFSTLSIASFIKPSPYISSSSSY